MAILDHLRKSEEIPTEVSTEDILEELGSDFNGTGIMQKLKC